MEQESSVVRQSELELCTELFASHECVELKFVIT
jgi:hypothetical protein